VCSAYTSQTKGLQQPRSYTKIVQYVSKTLPIYEAALRKLEALKAIRNLGEAAQRRDFPALSTAASQAQLAGSQSRQAAAALGMHVCAQLATGR
jgi:hypothetical protein